MLKPRRQVDGLAVIDAQPGRSPNKGLLQIGELDLVEGIGVSGKGRALGQDIESGKEPQSRIEGVLDDVRISLRAKELQSKEGKEVVACCNGFGARQSCRLDQFVEPQLNQEGGKKEDARRC